MKSSSVSEHMLWPATFQCSLFSLRDLSVADNINRDRSTVKSEEIALLFLIKLNPLSVYRYENILLLNSRGKKYAGFNFQQEEKK